MRRLFNSIERIQITGDLGQLSGLVRDIDRSLQNIANGTERLMEYLSRYSATNAGRQFEKMAEAASALGRELCQASMAINQMQRDICTYENKIRRFEGLSESAEMPNLYLVSPRRITVDERRTVIDLAEMRFLLQLLVEYSDIVEKYRSEICEKRDAISDIWRDPQYLNFSAFIDEVNDTIIKANVKFGNYIEYLRNRIQALQEN